MTLTIPGSLNGPLHLYRTNNIPDARYQDHLSFIVNTDTDQGPRPYARLVAAPEVWRGPLPDAGQWCSAFLQNGSARVIAPENNSPAATWLFEAAALTRVGRAPPKGLSELVWSATLPAREVAQYGEDDMPEPKWLFMWEEDVDARTEFSAWYEPESELPPSSSDHLHCRSLTPGSTTTADLPDANRNYRDHYYLTQVDPIGVDLSTNEIMFHVDPFVTVVDLPVSTAALLCPSDG